MRTKLQFFLAGLLTSASVSAEIYKSVGANGKVIYTNVRPEGKAPARTASAPLPARTAAGDGSAILGPDVIGAVANVMGVAQLVSSSRTFCVAAMPTAYKRYSSSAQGWEKRNSAVVALKDRVLSHPVQQLIAESLSADMIRKTATLMKPITLSDTAARVQWCDKAFADVDRGALDLVGRPSIAPLMNYGRR